MPLIGLYTPGNIPVLFEEIRDLSHAEIEELFGLPAPVIFSLIGKEREPYTDDQVSVTELAGDLRQALLKRRHPYYMHPLDLAWPTLGTAWHNMLEAYDPASEARAEVSVQADVDGLEIRGRIDHWWEEEGILTDWKLTSAWSAKAMRSGEYWWQEKPDWGRQLSHYVAMLSWQGKQVRTARVVCHYRDYQPRHEGKSGYPASPVEIFEMPVAKMPRFTKLAQMHLVTKARQWLELRFADDDELGKCDDLWGLNAAGLPRRCARYCPVNTHCNQWTEARRNAGVPS